MVAPHRRRRCNSDSNDHLLDTIAGVLLETYPAIFVELCRLQTEWNISHRITGLLCTWTLEMELCVPPTGTSVFL